MNGKQAKRLRKSAHILAGDQPWDRGVILQKKKTKAFQVRNSSSCGRAVYGKLKRAYNGSR